MDTVKIDPRILRTKKFIIDAFLELSRKKSFRDISVKDITQEAMINRATFYNHFLDKYDLLEKVVSENLSSDLSCASHDPGLSIEETIRQVFLSLTTFQSSMEHYWSSQEEIEMIHTIVDKELNRIFKDMIIEQHMTDSPSMMLKLANWLTAGVTGMSKDWVQSGIEESPEEYIESMLPFILNGLHQDK